MKEAMSGDDLLGTADSSEFAYFRAIAVAHFLTKKPPLLLCLSEVFFCFVYNKA